MKFEYKQDNKGEIVARLIQSEYLDSPALLIGSIHGEFKGVGLFGDGSYGEQSLTINDSDVILKEFYKGDSVTITF